MSLDMFQSGFPIVRAINHRWGLALEEVPTSAVFDLTVTDRRPGKQPISDRRLIHRIDETWHALEALSKQTERVIEQATA
jgi:hypothetical protein